MKSFFTNTVKEVFSKKGMVRKAGILAGIFGTFSIGLSAAGGLVGGKSGDLMMLQGAMDSGYSNALPTTADMSNYGSMKSFIGRLGNKAADVSIDVERAFGDMAAFHAKIGQIGSDGYPTYISLKEGEKKLFQFSSGYGQDWKGSIYENAYNHYKAKGDQQGMELAQRAHRSLGALDNAVGSKIGSWNAKGGGHAIDIASSVIEAGKNGDLHVYGWDIYDFAAKNSNAKFFYGKVGPNSLKGTKFYKAATNMPDIDPIYQTIDGKIVPKGTPGAKDIKLGSLFETKGGIKDYINKNVLWELQEHGVPGTGEKMLKPTTVWAATFNAEGKSLENATLKSVTSLRLGKTVARAMVGNWHYSLLTATGTEVVGLVGLAALGKRRRKTGNKINDALANGPDDTPEPANKVMDGTNVESALNQEPPSPPESSNRIAESTKPQNVVDSSPPYGPPEPANVRMPSTDATNVLQSNQPLPSQRQGKIKSEDALQRAQVEIDARREIAEGIRARRERARQARNTSRGNSGEPPIPTTKERFEAFSEHFRRKEARKTRAMRDSKARERLDRFSSESEIAASQESSLMDAQANEFKRRREIHEARMQRQKENAAGRRNLENELRAKRRAELIDRQMSNRETVQAQRAENRMFSTQSSLQERLESFKAVKRYSNINPTKTLDDITNQSNIRRNIFSFNKDNFGYNLNTNEAAPNSIFNFTNQPESPFDFTKAPDVSISPRVGLDDITRQSKRSNPFKVDNTRRYSGLNTGGYGTNSPIEYQRQPIEPPAASTPTGPPRKPPKKRPTTSATPPDPINPSDKDINPITGLPIEAGEDVINPLDMAINPETGLPIEPGEDIINPPSPANPIAPETKVEEAVKRKRPKAPKPANKPTGNVSDVTNSVSTPRVELNNQQKLDVRSTQAREKVEQQARNTVDKLKNNRTKPKLTPAEVDKMYARRAAAKAARNSTRRAPQAPPTLDPRLAPLDPSKFHTLDPRTVTYKQINNFRYDLAKIAKSEGIDLSKLDRMDYARYAVKHQIPIRRDELILDPFLRNVTDPLNAENAQNQLLRHHSSFVNEQGKTIHANDTYFKRIKNFSNTSQFNHGENNILPGVMDGVNGSQRYLAVNSQRRGWFHYQFYTLDPDLNALNPLRRPKPKVAEDVFKSYVSFNNISESLSVESIQEFARALTEGGYNGSFKTISNIAEAREVGDHLVMHGHTLEDSKIALDVAKKVFGDKIKYTDAGFDPHSGGSYSTMLQMEIDKAVYMDRYTAGTSMMSFKNSNGTQHPVDYINEPAENHATLHEFRDIFHSNNVNDPSLDFIKAGPDFLPSAKDAIITPTPPTAPPIPAKPVNKARSVAENNRRRRERRQNRRRNAAAKRAQKNANTPKNQPINDPTQAVNNASTPRSKVDGQQKDTKRNRNNKQRAEAEAQSISNQGTQASQDAKNNQGNADAIADKAASEEEKAAINAQKEAIDAVKEPAEKLNNASKAAAVAEDPVAGKAAAEAVKDAAAELASKYKTTLSHAGLAGAGAAGLFALYTLSRDSRKEQIAPRRRHGRVHENPRGYDDGLKATAGASAALGAVFGMGALAANSFNPQVRAFMAIGGAVAGGIGLSAINKGIDSKSSILGMAGAGAAATLMYALVSKRGTAGLKALKSFVSRQGPKASIDAAENAVREIRKTFPAVGRLLSSEGLALGTGLVTLPVAHSIMVKHFANERRNRTDHGDIGTMPSLQDNKAGHTGFRRTNAPLLAVNTANTANVNFSGNVNTYYNSANIFERF